MLTRATANRRKYRNGIGWLQDGIYAASQERAFTSIHEDVNVAVKIFLRIQHLPMQSRKLPDNLINQLAQCATRRKGNIYLPAAHNLPQSRIKMDNHLPTSFPLMAIQISRK